MYKSVNINIECNYAIVIANPGDTNHKNGKFLMQLSLNVTIIIVTLVIH